VILYDIGVALEVYVVVLFIRAVLSWFPIHPGGAMSSINTLLWRLTEPVLAPVRRLIPPLSAGGGGLDLSFLVVVIALQIIAAAFMRAG
jgi:YggT family protein